jgi:hypothetical protein
MATVAPSGGGIHAAVQKIDGGTNAAPSAAGSGAADSGNITSLTGRGWVVTTN